ncbi:MULTISPECIES: iron-containing alcohol dehydrogenase [Alteromonas]|uniref:Alcohol dehydrogenase n=1 Tax=Alteromonas stellipolaris TaxID=233316 RepID=A0AAW7Z6B6_9ALTE|nr:MULTISPECIES: iron-containing alcohol dehydrogenase [Alteromonas]AMJ89301.1 alcohol dehydrogenase [Alteromonas sp. Mac2]ALM92169.1 Alcohol dehydrogenase [Alteromonas stellipolaris LMG 21856]AMJ73024.1 alcohol dehydrogenase [Alteromonas stellipolaris]AMJ85416.1 alcohol dehydrogenase [Alteromonas sp. Mac1]ANB20329.1 alcohol dehydrogenase [Alteromonas stellipolaris]
MQVSVFKSANKLITGEGALANLANELSRLNIKAPAIITDKGVSQSGALSHVTNVLNCECTIVIDDIPPEPEIGIIEQRLTRLKQHKVDGIIAVGGGSAIDSAKVLAATFDYTGNITELFGENLVAGRTLPLIAIPTTAGTGSEVTNIAILADPIAHVKKGIVSDYLLPDVAIVTPEMTLSCPKHITAASGVDAFVHALEAYLSVNASPITDALASKAMTLIFHSLPLAYANGHDIKAREDMATGSLMAGLAFGNAGVGAVHALAYPLGGRFHLSHGMSNAVMLPHVMRWNIGACQQRFVDVAVFLHLPVANKTTLEIANQVVDAIEALCRNVEIPATLRDFDISEDAIPLLAEEASKVTRLLRNNPRVLSKQDIAQIYKEAF